MPRAAARTRDSWPAGSDELASPPLSHCVLQAAPAAVREGLSRVHEDSVSAYMIIITMHDSHLCPARLTRVEGRMSNTHAGKVAIVTGSARGIGAAIASQLASESAKGPS